MNYEYFICIAKGAAFEGMIFRRGETQCWIYAKGWELLNQFDINEFTDENFASISKNEAFLEML